MQKNLTKVCGALNKVYNAQRSDWDLHVLAVLWAYRTTRKKLTGQAPSRLAYGLNVVISMEYIMPSLHITSFIGMEDCEGLEDRLAQLVELEEDRFWAGFHQQVQKEREKEWHDRNIKLRTFKVIDLVLLYDRKFTKFPGKFHMHWLGPYVIKEITDGGAVHLTKMNRELFPGKVNGSQLKLYKGDPAPAQ